MTTPIATLETFLDRISAAPDAALVFVSGGAEIAPGYHVTELKRAEIQSVDCGRNRSAWRETIVQLLDGAEDGQSAHMTAGKFAEIARACLDALPDLADGALIFEFAPGDAPLRRLSVAGLDQRGGRFMVQLAAENAVCKPAASSSCCGPKASCCAA